ncbi:MAG: hypothetical protein ACTSPB_26115 [Candidatus Thorarchaeota archaeon]
MSESCSRCGKRKGKGKHYVTSKVAESTIRFEIRTCVECGKELNKRIANTLTKWARWEAEEQ